MNRAPTLKADLLLEGTIELGLEPLHCVILGEAVGEANAVALVLPARHTETRAAQHHVEIHTVNTGGGIVLDAQVNVLLNAEAEVA